LGGEFLGRRFFCSRGGGGTFSNESSRQSCTNQKSKCDLWGGGRDPETGGNLFLSKNGVGGAKSTVGGGRQVFDGA